jgi:hypothetical protein
MRINSNWTYRMIRTPCDSDHEKNRDKIMVFVRFKKLTIDTKTASNILNVANNFRIKYFVENSTIPHPRDL